jgi:carboxybiotin decarboxylase
VTPLVSVLPMVSVVTVAQPAGGFSGPVGQGLLARLLETSGLWNLTPANGVMVLIALLLLYVAVSRNWEPLTLVPLAFGVLLGNLSGDAWVLIRDDSALGVVYTATLTWLLPVLVFLGLGATMDLSAMLARPKTALIGVVVQLGIFAAFMVAIRLPAAPRVAAAIGMIAAAHGPTTLFAAGQLATKAVPVFALAAYSYLVLGPVLQPAVLRLLTSHAERAIKMAPGRPVSAAEAMALPVIGLLVTAVFVPGALPLVGAFCLGSFLKAVSLTSQLAKTMANTLLDIVTVLLAVAIGAAATAEYMLTRQVAQVFGVGILGFLAATVAGVLAAKILNAFGTVRVNPLVGAAAVGGLPGTTRVIEAMGLAEDPSNHLSGHAAAPAVAGLLGSALVAGLFLGLF